MGRPAVAARVEVLSPGLVRVTFEGEALRARQWQQGSEIEFRVSTRDFRHYTPASFDDDAGRIEVVFQLHGSGPGADWVRGVRTGDEVVILGPVRRSSWLRNGRRPVFVGDASALGLFQALIASLPDATDAVGVVEVPEADLDAASDLVPTLTVVASTDVPGEASLTWLADELSGTPDVAYLAGHAQSIQRQRAVLCDAAGDRPGLRRRNVVTKPFWATGKVGL
jgi:NADPH-dependent ferric siderophore reductase